MPYSSTSTGSIFASFAVSDLHPWRTSSPHNTVNARSNACLVITFPFIAPDGTVRTAAAFLTCFLASLNHGTRRRNDTIERDKASTEPWYDELGSVEAGYVQEIDPVLCENAEVTVLQRTQ